MGFKHVDNAFQKVDKKQMTHTYQKLTDANVANYLFYSFLKTRNNHTPNIIILSHSDGNRGEGGAYDSK